LAILTVYVVGVSFYLIHIYNSVLTAYYRDILPYFMLFERLHKRFFFTASMLFIAFLLNACSVTAPVQEMSNARQSIRAAKEVNAEKLATDIIAEAKQRLKSAMRELDAGEYERARTLAVEAKHLALKAHQLSVSKKTD